MNWELLISKIFEN